MSRSLRNATHGRGYFITIQSKSIRHGLPHDQFRQSRSAGDRRNASFRFEPCVDDLSIRNPQAQSNHISANWILNFGNGVRIVKIACPSRILEVTEKLRRIHRQTLYPEAAPGMVSGKSTASELAEKLSNACSTVEERHFSAA